ncbi:MAG: glutathione S-transferase N-terminal domain-containing protein [Pseudomonadota bacterium]
MRIFVAEKGIDLETVQVDLSAGEQFTEAFRKLNRFCTVPVLELDDGTAISEIWPICQYLEERYPDKPLLGETPEARARIGMWNMRVEHAGLAAVAESFRNHAKGFSGRAVTGALEVEQIPALVPRGRGRAEHFLAVLDEVLGERDYVAGPAFSIADITALVLVDFAAWIKLPVPESAANLRRWHEQVSARPSAKA